MEMLASAANPETAAVSISFAYYYFIPFLSQLVASFFHHGAKLSFWGKPVCELVLEL